jgi:hypothetical protein
VEFAISETMVVNRTVVLREHNVAVAPGIPPTLIAAAIGRPIRSFEVQPRVLAGTVNIPGAAMVRPEDIRNRQLQPVAVRQTRNEIRPSARAPELKPLRPGEQGRVLGTPPRAVERLKGQPTIGQAPATRDQPKAEPKAAGPKAAPKAEPKAAAPKVAPKAEPKTAAPKAAPKAEPKTAAPKAAPKAEPKTAAPKAAPKAEPRSATEGRGRVQQPQQSPQQRQQRDLPKAAAPKAAPKAEPRSTTEGRGGGPRGAAPKLDAGPKASPKRQGPPGPP